MRETKTDLEAKKAGDGATPADSETIDPDEAEVAAARTILDRGMRYQLAAGDIIIRPLRWGTVMTIAAMAAEAGLTPDAINAGRENWIKFFADFSNLALRCVAAAELNDRDLLTDENIDKRAEFYRDNLTVIQVCELFVHVLSLGGMQSFTNTIGLLLTMRQKYLSPKERGS